MTDQNDLFHVETRQKADVLFSVPSKDAVVPGPGVPTPPRPTLLGVGQTFTSPVREVDGYSAILFLVLSDQPFQVRIQESNTPTGPVGQTSVTASTLDPISFLQKVVLRVAPSGSFMKILVDNLGAQQNVFLLTGLGIPIAGSGSSSSGGGGAPSTSTFVLVSADPSLSNARVITAGVGIAIVDGGPGGTLTISATGAGAESLEQARAIGDTFTGGNVFWDNAREAVFGKASGEANQDYLRVYSDKVGSLQVLDSTKDGAGTIRPMSFQMGGVEAVRITSARLVLVGLAAPDFSDAFVEARRDQNLGTVVYVYNATDGTGAEAAFSATGTYSGGARRGAITVGFASGSNTSHGGFFAGRAYITSVDPAAGGDVPLLLTTVPVSAIIFAPALTEAARFLPTGQLVVGATAVVGSEILRVNGDVYIDGKLTVLGAIDPTSVSLSDPAAGTALFLDSADGGTAPVSAAGHARIRYNDPTGWEESVNGGAYTPFGGGGGASEEDIWYKDFFSSVGKLPANVYKEEFQAFPTPDWTDIGAGSASIIESMYRFISTGNRDNRFGFDLPGNADRILFLVGGIRFGRSTFFDYIGVNTGSSALTKLIEATFKAAGTGVVLEYLGTASVTIPDYPRVVNDATAFPMSAGVYYDSVTGAADFYVKPYGGQWMRMAQLTGIGAFGQVSGAFFRFIPQFSGEYDDFVCPLVIRYE